MFDPYKHILCQMKAQKVSFYNVQPIFAYKHK